MGENDICGPQDRIGGISMTEKKKRKGLAAVLQQTTAKAVRTVYDELIPKAAETASDLLAKTGIEPQLRDRAVTFLYDDLEQFNLYTPARALYEQTKEGVPQNAVTRILLHFLDQTMDCEDGRSNLRDGITDSVLDALRSAAADTPVSALFEDDMILPIRDFLTEGFGAMLRNLIGDETMDKILGFVDTMQHLTVGYVLSEAFGLDRDTMIQKIDGLYSRYLGEDMVNQLKEEQKGAKLAEEIESMEPNEFLHWVFAEHGDELVSAAARAVGTAVSAKKLFSGWKRRKH